jgi:hypothetical protein
LGSALVLLYTFDLVDASGRTVQRETVAVCVTLARSCRRLSMPLVHAVDRSGEVRATLQAALVPRLEAGRTAIEPVAARLDARLLGLCQAIDARRRDVVAQGSLFDRREEQRARAQRAQIVRWCEHLADRRRAVDALTRLTAGEARLVAAWLSEAPLVGVSCAEG